MKRLGTIIVVVLAAALLQACNGITKTDNDDDTDSAIAVRDTATRLTFAIDKEDAQFAIKAANNNLAEIEAGQMAMKKGADKRIKNFGAMMVKNYTKANTKLAALATLKKIELPDSVGSVEQKNIDALSTKTGKAFDSAYINYMIASHKNAIDLFEDAAKHRFDPDVRKYAGKTWPMFKRHLDAIEGIRVSIK